MNRAVFLVLFLVALVSFACGGGSSSPAAPSSSSSSPSPSPSPTPSPAPSATPGGVTQSRYTWRTEGVRIDGPSNGFTGAFADSTTIRLTDGRYRVYVFGNGRYRSAISPDGLTFSVESTFPVPEGYGHMRVIRMPDGRIRAFNISGDGIVSSVSSDEGVSFTPESGFRVTASAIGFTPSGISIVRMASGIYRMYFSTLPRPGEFVPHRVRSAFSSDMLTWTLDDGIRIGTGAQLTGSAEHPGAIANPDGSVSLFYFRNTALRLLMATARDGVTFTEEFDTGISEANDPDLVALPDGTVRMYYNWGSDAGGRVLSATYSGSAFTANSLAPVAPLAPAGPAAGSQAPWRRFGFTPAR